MTFFSRLATVSATAAALAALSFSWFGAVQPVVLPAVVALLAPVDAAHAESLVCEVRSGRSQGECDEETAGKALIREADLAQRGGHHVRPAAAGSL